MHKYIEDSSSVIKKLDMEDHMKEHPFVKVDLQHIEGAFVIWWAGIGVSSIVFLIELLSIYAVKKYHPVHRQFHL